MSIQSVLLPVLLQVLLTFALLGLMAARRMLALRAGLRPQDTALSTTAYPPAARQARNSYANQFEMPMLFLFAVIFALVLHQAGRLFVAVEWLFLAMRVAHAGVHVTSNDLRLRSPLFIASAAATALLWLLIFAGVFFGTVIG